LGSIRPATAGTCPQTRCTASDRSLRWPGPWSPRGASDRPFFEETGEKGEERG
jgi:hypothetical protein